MKKIFVFAASLSICASAAAQQLDTEVNLERTVQPVLRDAQRLRGVVPSIVVPPVTKQRLSVAEYAGTGTLTDELVPMGAARWADSIARTPYRGYASLGYFPVFNMGADAGYRIIDTKALGVGVYGSYSGMKYNSGVPFSPDASFLNNFITGGADATYHPNEAGWLSVNAEYTYGAVRRPFLDSSQYDQGSNYFDMKAAWRSRAGAVKYDVAADLGRFSFTDAMPVAYAPAYSALGQTYFSLSAGAGACRKDETTPWLGIDADWDVVRSNCLQPAPLTATMHEVHLTPYVRFGVPVFEVSLGARMSIGAGFGGNTFKVAPAVTLSLTPMAPLSVFARLSGGERINRAADLYASNPYLYQYKGYGRSNMPVRLDAGVTFTPVAGVTVGAGGGYAMTDDWLLPAVHQLLNGLWQSEYAASNFNSWYLGLNAKIVYRSLFTFKAEGSLGGADKDYASWCDWDDAATLRASLELTSTPIEALEVGAGFDFTSGRKGLVFDNDYVPSKCSLGAVRNLRFHAAYHISPILTVFLRADNLLNQHHLLVSRLPSPGLHGLVGLAIQF